MDFGDAKHSTASPSEIKVSNLQQSCFWTGFTIQVNHPLLVTSTLRRDPAVHADSGLLCQPFRVTVEATHAIHWRTGRTTTSPPLESTGQSHGRTDVEQPSSSRYWVTIAQQGEYHQWSRP